MSDRYETMKARALAMGGPEKLARRRAAGVLNARERVDGLVDPGTFIESGLFGSSGSRPEDRDRSPADGKVAGFGKIGGRECAIVANDFTVMGASSGATNGRKIGHMKRVATSRGLPMIFLGESSGARMPDHMGARGMGTLLGNDPTQYARLRETPWASATLGLSYGSSSWYAVLSDFCVLRKGAVLAVSSPQLASLALKEQVDPQAMGGWKVHAEVTGFADYVAETDEDALAAIRTFLSYLPSHHKEAPPEHAVPPDSGKAMAGYRQAAAREAHAGLRRAQHHARHRRLRQLLRAEGRFGKVAVTGLARLGGRTVGIVANNPLFKGGAMDTDACEKVTSFLVLCDSFNIPMVLLVDTTGLLDRHRGRAQPRAGQDHELHAGAAAVHRAEDLGHPAQELRPGLSQHGRRAELRRGGGVADRRGELHGPDLRGEDRARPGARRAGLRRGLRADEQGQRALGHRRDRTPCSPSSSRTRRATI